MQKFTYSMALIVIYINTITSYVTTPLAL